MRLLAHQGGWDELALVAFPLLVFTALLWLARRRAQQEQESDEDEAPPTSSHQ